jgi:hypothetical protein
MKHARKDYDRIQDPAGKIGIDEPVFLIRAQDLAGPMAVEAYAAAAAVVGASEEMINLCRRWARTMKRWQIENGGKIPDL